MARSANQKLKLLYMADILTEESDEAHPLSAAHIIEKLAARGIAAERKSIYTDLEALRFYGLDIVAVRGRGTGYFVASRAFELPELKLLADAVGSAKFITEKKSRDLISKLGRLTSRAEAERLRRQVCVTGRAKAANERIYYNVDEIHRAIAEDSEIAFKYFEYNLDKQKVYRDGGRAYYVSPYALAWDDENYYMLAHHKKYGRVAHFRVDKMEDIALTGTPRERAENFDPGAYQSRVFDMFSGEETTVRLKFSNDLIGVALDRFGKDIIVVKGPDGFTVNVKVAVSPSFFGWVFKFCGKVQIVVPEPVARQMGQMCAAQAALYRGEADA